MIGRRLRHARTGFGDLLNHLKSTRESESGILMGVHPAGFLEGWVFGDFQSPRLSPDEPSIQPIEASHLDRVGCQQEVAPQHAPEPRTLNAGAILLKVWTSGVAGPHRDGVTGMAALRCRVRPRGDDKAVASARFRPLRFVGPGCNNRSVRLAKVRCTLASRIQCVRIHSAKGDPCFVQFHLPA